MLLRVCIFFGKIQALTDRLKSSFHRSKNFADQFVACTSDLSTDLSKRGF
jgi:hypothetical protein